jgi:hypothetical protein
MNDATDAESHAIRRLEHDLQIAFTHSQERRGLRETHEWTGAETTNPRIDPHVPRTREGVESSHPTEVDPRSFNPDPAAGAKHPSSVPIDRERHPDPASRRITRFLPPVDEANIVDHSDLDPESPDRVSHSETMSGGEADFHL